MSDECHQKPFHKQMRESTAKVHSISDHLINAKLGFALSNTRVWSDGLLIFYEIFKYLENAMSRLEHTCLSEFDVPGLRRIDGFEKDLAFYLGPNWKEGYEPHVSVKEYINHLKELEDRDHLLLIAYIYHLYMGILSGGQILRKKRALSFSARDATDGLAALDVSDVKVFKIKKDLVDALNRIAGDLDDHTRQEILEESVNVFLLNNKVVRSIDANDVVLIKFIKLAVAVAILAVVLYVILH